MTRHKLQSDNIVVFGHFALKHIFVQTPHLGGKVLLLEFLKQESKEVSYINEADVRHEYILSEVRASAIEMSWDYFEEVLVSDTVKGNFLVLTYSGIILV